MASFRISVTPHRRVAAKFIAEVRRKIQKAYADRPDITQASIANELGVHRSVINRQLKGRQDMTLGRVAELSYLLGFEPEFMLVEQELQSEANEAVRQQNASPFSVVVNSSSALVTTDIKNRELERV